MIYLETDVLKNVLIDQFKLKINKNVNKMMDVRSYPRESFTFIYYSHFNSIGVEWIYKLND